jgi:CMP-N-acetylneuraminic acid synthetase
MKTVAFIFARKGSKRIKNKNTKILNGKPLIIYTLDFIKKIKFIDKIVISTNDQKIIDICKKKNFRNIIYRPKSLALDNTDEFKAWQHGIKEFLKINYNYNTFICLPLTAPLREKKDLDSAYKVYKKKKLDMIISVCKTNHFPDFNMVTKNKNNKLRLITEKHRKPILMRKNIYNLTTCFYIASTDYILNNKSINLNSKKIEGFEVSRRSGIDIDDYFDLEVAKFFLRKKK